jgi:hypothetical protein
VRVMSSPPVGFGTVAVAVSVQISVASSYEPEYVTVPPSNVSVRSGTAAGSRGSGAAKRIARALLMPASPSEKARWRERSSAALRELELE